jgi:hypothetical protein
MTKHTPGPWVRDDESIYGTGDCAWKQVAEIPGWRTNPGEVLTAEDNANARLITAAPDMLDALHHFYNIVSTGVLHQTSLSKEGIIELLKDAQEAAHTAIAKATGG